MLFAVAAAAESRTTYYETSCHGCGESRIDIGSHTFCALATVHSGGFSSACSVGGSGRSWNLRAIDPDKGETQACRAVCLDLDGVERATESHSTVETVSPARPTAQQPSPAASEKILGTYKTTFGDMTIARYANPVTGTYTHKSGKIEGVLNGTTLTGKWQQSNGRGRFVFKFSADFSSFSGQWSYNDAEPDKPWTGTK